VTRFGRDVASVGDVTGDGVNDLAVFSAGFLDEQGQLVGRILIVNGAGLLDGFDPEKDLIQEIRGKPSEFFFGVMRDLGDYDQNGSRDLLVTVIYNGTFQESAHIYSVQLPLPSDCNGNGKSDSEDIASGGSSDCDGNGVPDECDIASGMVSDGNENGIPDACEPRPNFHRGDVNGDGTLDISDGLCTLAFLFDGGVEPLCLESGDANNDGKLDCSDSFWILGYLFMGTRPPESPGPPSAPCGPDPDALGSPADLGCASYTHCISPN
jgi:hypothetical protein